MIAINSIGRYTKIVPTFATRTQLPRYLYEEQQHIESIAEGYGLDFFPTVFEVLAYDQMNEVASYGGFPTRYPHWRFGMEYERMAKSAEYGLAKIYEMVINNNPSIAYLLEGNSLVDQKLVMAHVYAHVDFFKNNFVFGTTDQGTDARTGVPIRKWIDTMANHGTVVRRWANRIGIEQVEAFIDDCLSLENLIDPNKPYLPTKRDTRSEFDAENEAPEELRLLRVDQEYMESFINPEEFVEAQRQKLVSEKEKTKRTPERPERDVLGFLIDNGPLERWERDVLRIIRDEAYYFFPQMQTKVMNEGWASYWHSRIMTEKVCNSAEIIEYAERNAGVMATSPGTAEPLQAGGRALPPCRGAMESRAVRQGVGRLRRSRGTAPLEPPHRPRPKEDLRGTSALQRRDLHRRVSHAGVCPRAEALRLRLQHAERPLGDRDTEVRGGEKAPSL